MNRIIRLWRKGYSGDGGAYQGEMGRIISSCDRFPAHEVSYPVLERLLFQIGKKRRKESGKSKV